MALDEFLQVFAGVRNMFPQSGRGQFGIFRPADIQKFAVRLAGAVQVTREDQVETSVAVTVDVKFLQERQHDRTIGGRIECGMETPVPPAPGLHLRIILKRLFVLAKDVFSALELIFLHIRDRAAQHVALQNRARYKPLHDLAEKESRINRASIADNGNEPFSRQMAERFTHRNTADLKFGGNGVLPKLFSFAQFATEDFFCKPLDNSSRKGLSGDRCGLFWGDPLHIWAKIHKHHDTGNCASKISTLKNIDQSLENLSATGLR